LKSYTQISMDVFLLPASMFKDISYLLLMNIRDIYIYLYFLTDKAETLNAFKTYKVEVEKQKEKKIKIVRSDRGGEYYSRHTKNGQMIGPLAKFLQAEGIVAQYMMPDTPQ